MILLNLNRNSQLPLHRQVYAQISTLIDNKLLSPGSKLPPTRILADKHGVSRSTVLKAYQELWAQGYLESRPGSYSLVRRKMSRVTVNERSERPLINWDNRISSVTSNIFKIYNQSGQLSSYINQPGIIDLASFELDSRLFPVDEFKKCLNKVINTDHERIFNYGTAQGYAPLRNYISERLQTHGTYVNADEILITNGSQSGMDLVLKMLCKPGSSVVVESPTYPNMIPLLHAHQAEIIAVEIQHDGIDTGQLQEILKAKQPALIYTMPNFQNPTGITMSQQKREMLFSLAEKYRVPILEDAFEEEMKYFGKIHLPIKAFDRQQIVIYLGSFSKVLFPGIRMGWIAADRQFIDRIIPVKKYSDLTSGTLIQAALSEFCFQGYYDMHIKRIHRIYKKRMQIALCELKKRIRQAHVKWQEPLGGYLILIKFADTGVNEKELTEILAQNGVLLLPSSSLTQHKSRDHYFRLTISQVNEAEIIEGINRLSRAVDKIYRGGNTA